MAFGESSSIYDRGRRGYPEEVIQVIKQGLNGLSPFLWLDVGCGTGVSTRQLASDDGLVVGCDHDNEMVEMAIKARTAHTCYCVGTADNLPFGPQLFDGISTFGAFHWFATPEAIAEMRRVAKPNARIWIVNKDDTGHFREDLDAIVAASIGKTYDSPKTSYVPERLLREQGCTAVVTRAFPTTELFTLDELATLVRSMNIWTTVPPAQRATVLDRVTERFSSEVNSERQYERRITVRIISARL